MKPYIGVQWHLHVDHEWPWKVSSRSPRFQTVISCKRAYLDPMLQLNINGKPYMGNLMAPIDLTLSDIERSKSRSFRYWIIEDRYSVNIYLLVIFDINLDAPLCNLLVRGVFQCPSGLSWKSDLGRPIPQLHLTLSDLSRSNLYVE